MVAVGCSGIGTVVNRLPDDAAARGYVSLPKPVSLPRGRYTKTCLPESLCAVVNYLGKAASVEEFLFLGQKENQKGMTTNQIAALARTKGCKTTFVDGSVGRIKNAIDRGLPPIIQVDSGGGLFHCFVVTGYSDRESNIVCEDYNDTKRLIPYLEIEALWENAKHVMAEVEISKADEFLADAVGFDAKGEYGEAVVFYRKALEADPNLFEARFGLGNCLYFQHKLEEALAEYLLAYAANSADPRVCNNLANVYLELKRELPEAERLAGLAVDRYRTALQQVRSAVEQESTPALRQLRQKELRYAETDLADSLATLGQALAANGRHDRAIASWKAARDHYPLTEFDVRARRLLEIALSCRALNMPVEARENLEAALREARDPDLRARIEAALKP